MVIEDDEDRASPAGSGSTVTNAFGIMMAPQATKKSVLLRDRCFRPTLLYNDNYNPQKPPNEKNKEDYSPYDFGEPLFDDRAVIIDRLPAGHVVAAATKRPRTSWTWKLGYALVNTLKASKPTIWCYKLCISLSNICSIIR